MLHTHIVLQKRIHVSALISSSFLLVLSILAFFPVASSFSDTLAAPVQSETTLSMTAENINLNLSVDNPNGTFNASDPASLTVATNNYTGYTLSILASASGSDATKLVNGEHEFSSISTTSSASDFNNGNWGLLPSKVNSAANSSYIPAPTSEGTTLDATNSANADANSYTIALGAKADYTLPAGRYSNTFVITAVANPVGYSITYNKNTEDEVGNMPATQAGDLEDTDITVSANTPTRIGYVFNNWCDDTVTATNGIDACAGNTYEPGDTFATSMQTTNNLALTAMWNRTFTLNFDANGGTGAMNPQTITGVSAAINMSTFTRQNYTFDGWNTAADGTGSSYADEDTFTVPASGTSTTLYAQWRVTFADAFAAAGKTTVTINGNQYYKMQDITSSICAAVTKSRMANYADTEEAQLVDTRDNKIYWVAKTLDDNCWMTQNLDHDIVTTANFYTPANTDITEEWLPTRATIQPTSIDPSTGAISNWADDYDTPYSVNPGDWYWTDTWYYSSSYNYLANGENSQFKTSPFSGNGEHGHMGNYYNWSAATATNNTSNTITDGTNLNTSICPKGWRLPAILSTNDFMNLLNAYNAYNTTATYRDRELTMAPLYFVRGGELYSGVLDYAGFAGHYWSSTVNDWDDAYLLNFGSIDIYPSDYDGRTDGSPVRCLAR